MLKPNCKYELLEEMVVVFYDEPEVVVTLEIGTVIIPQPITKQDWHDSEQRIFVPSKGMETGIELEDSDIRVRELTQSEWSI